MIVMSLWYFLKNSCYRLSCTKYDSVNKHSLLKRKDHRRSLCLLSLYAWTELAEHVSDWRVMCYVYSFFFFFFQKMIISDALYCTCLLSPVQCKLLGSRLPGKMCFSNTGLSVWKTLQFGVHSAHKRLENTNHVEKHFKVIQCDKVRKKA